MTRDPYTILGISPDATLAEARAAYRRLAELFHPDRLQGLRRDVQDEGAQRLREATEAMKAIRARLGRPLVAPGHGPRGDFSRAKTGPQGESTPTTGRATTGRPTTGRPTTGTPTMPVPRGSSEPVDRGWKPSDAATKTEGRLYDVDLRAVDGAPFHVRWRGRHAAAILAALRHGHQVEGTIRQVEWGCYQVNLDGGATRRLLRSVLGDTDWEGDLAEVLELDAQLETRSLPIRPDQVIGSAITLGALIEFIDEVRWYSVLADVY